MIQINGMEEIQCVTTEWFETESKCREFAEEYITTKPVFYSIEESLHLTPKYRATVYYFFEVDDLLSWLASVEPDDFFLQDEARKKYATNTITKAIINRNCCYAMAEEFDDWFDKTRQFVSEQSRLDQQTP